MTQGATPQLLEALLKLAESAERNFQEAKRRDFADEPFGEADAAYEVFNDEDRMERAIEYAWCEYLYDLALEAHARHEAVEQAASEDERAAWLRHHERYGRRYGSPRRRFPKALLALYPLTQPAHACKRCGRTDPEGLPLELDHMMALVNGGPDHPHNLIRLCSECHRAKPDVGPNLADARLAMLAWVAAYPVRWLD